jgi:cysteinyl-tRNA synthetase
LGAVLGILQDDPEAYLRGGAEAGGLSDADIENLIRRRAEARQARAWAEADRLRDEIQAAGILLEDGAGGTTWRRGG